MEPLKSLRNNIIADALSKESGVFSRIEVATPAIATGKLSMIITFQGMEKIRIPSHELNVAAKVTGFCARSDVTRIIEYDFEHPSQIEKMLFECAWALGSAFLIRYQFYPYQSDKGWTGREPGAGITRLFEGSPYRSPLGGSFSVGQTDTTMTDLAIKHGYWLWNFKPTYNHHLPEANNLYWKLWYAEDPTRNDRGFREDVLPSYFKIENMEQKQENGIKGRMIDYDLTKAWITEHTIK